MRHPDACGGCGSTSPAGCDCRGLYARTPWIEPPEGVSPPEAEWYCPWSGTLMAYKYVGFGGDPEPTHRWALWCPECGTGE